jgi:hypothetical protein
MALPITPGSGASVASDIISGEHHQQLKLEFGAVGVATLVSSTNPLPVREPVRGNALSKNGTTSAGTSTPVVAANSSRNYVEVSNGGDSGVWLAFGSTAVVGQGTYLPAKATGFWPTTAAVNCILESGGTGGPIGYTEW